MLRTRPTRTSENSSTTTTDHHATSTLPQHITRALDHLTRTELRLQSSIADLAESNGPVAETAKLTEDIRREMKGLLKNIEDLKLAADEQDRDQDVKLILTKLTRHEEQYRQLQISLRKASLSAKKNMDAAAQKEREDLLKGSAERRTERISNLQGNESLVSTSNELTDSLRQAVQMMSAEVERSAQTAKSIEDSTTILRQTNTEYRNFQSILGTSKRLVTRLKQRDWTDRLLLVFGVLVFLMSVVHVVRGRIRIWVPGWNMIMGRCGEGRYVCL
ncbi:hypothetical protein HDV00_009418 [Rhizophlyctis rosea]|nr:hypothetical protein HDV00_009418 [Rhizophlyctis rosea]